MWSQGYSLSSENVYSFQAIEGFSEYRSDNAQVFSPESEALSCPLMSERLNGTSLGCEEGRSSHGERKHYSCLTN